MRLSSELGSTVLLDAMSSIKADSLLLDLIELVAVRLQPIPIHLRRHALDDAAMIGEKDFEAGRAQHAEKAVAVKMAGSIFRGPGKINRGDRQRRHCEQSEKREAI